MQLIVFGQERGSRASLELTGGLTALLGYSPEFGVFIGWEARLYRDFGYSANVQVREELLQEARRVGWAVAPPRKKGVEEEVRIAFSPGNLIRFLRITREADRRELHGKWREAFFLSRVPNTETQALPRSERELVSVIDGMRQRIASTRAVRDASFGPRVKSQYEHSCAVCQLQLEIVEGAHIIPVRENGSRDELWNGICLCPNHHTLFDASSFVITPELRVVVDSEVIGFLRESGRASGIETLTIYDGGEVRKPHFWTRDSDLRQRMVQALERRSASVATA